MCNHHTESIHLNTFANVKENSGLKLRGWKKYKQLIVYKLILMFDGSKKAHMRILTYVLLIITLLSACNNASNSSTNDTNSNYYYDEEKFEDGTYSAMVDYYNPKTGYSATYTLDVEIEDNQVTVIYFPNDGYLDDDHIWPDELDEDGFVSIEGEEGKTYDIQIDY